MNKRQRKKKILNGLSTEERYRRTHCPVCKEKIDRGNISFGIVSEATGIPAKRVERIYRNDLPKEDEIVSILDWVGK